MNLPNYIARRVASARGITFSRIIIRIAIIAVALCMTVMICTTALVRGFKTEISNKIFGFWGHVHIMSNEVIRSFEAIPIPYDTSLVNDLKSIEGLTFQEPVRIFGWEIEALQRRMETNGGIASIHPFAQIPGIIKTSDELEGIILKGVGETYDWSFFKQYIVDGEIPDWTGSEPGRELIISTETARRLSLKPGDRFVMHFIRDGRQLPRRFEVGAIYNTGLKEYDEKIAVGDLRVLRSLYGWADDEIGGYEMMLDDIRDLGIVTEYVYYDVISNDLFVENIRRKYPAIFQWLDLQDKNESLILTLMVLVSVINLITTLLILILERRTMIGVFKALGARDWAVQQVFLYYGARIILRGLFWGNLLGLGLCFLQDRFHLIKLSEADYYLSYAPIDVQWMIILLLNIGTVLITLLFLILPSYLVARIDPVRAIQFN